MMGTNLRVQMNWNRLNFNSGLFVLKPANIICFFKKAPFVKITIKQHFSDYIDNKHH